MKENSKTIRGMEKASRRNQTAGSIMATGTMTMSKAMESKLGQME